MSSDRSAPAIDLPLRPSRLIAAFLFATHGGALAVITAAQLPPWAVALLASGVLTSFVVYARRHVLLRGRGAVRRLQWTAAGRWLIHEVGRTEPHEARLLPGAHVGARWLALSFRSGRRRLHVLIVSDNAPRDAVRRLRVRLNHEKPDQ